MTRLEQIRSMTDEDIAEFFCEFFSKSKGLCSGCVAESYCRVGHNGMIDWLQEEGDIEC